MIYFRGRPERCNMISIGINYSQMHDSSACIARDGEVFSPWPRSASAASSTTHVSPRFAIRACLDFAAIRPDQVDFICQGWSRRARGFCTI